MCWNKEVSLISFIFPIIVSFYIFYRNNVNDRFFAILISLASFMQLLEFFMWVDIDCKKKYNIYATKIALILLYIQPLMVVLASLFSNNNLKKKYFNKRISRLQIVLLVTSLIFPIYGIHKSLKKNIDDKYWCSKKGPNCHLVWGFIENSNYIPNILYKDKLFGIFYAIPFTLLLFIEPFWQKILLIFIIVGTYLISFYLYKKSKEASSIWCWVGSLTSFIWLLLNSKK